MSRFYGAAAIGIMSLEVLAGCVPQDPGVHVAPETTTRPPITLFDVEQPTPGTIADTIPLPPSEREVELREDFDAMKERVDKEIASGQVIGTTVLGVCAKVTDRETATADGQADIMIVPAPLFVTERIDDDTSMNAMVTASESGEVMVTDPVVIYNPGGLDGDQAATTPTYFDFGQELKVANDFISLGDFERVDGTFTVSTDGIIIAPAGHVVSTSVTLFHGLEGAPLPDDIMRLINEGICTTEFIKTVTVAVSAPPTTT